MEFCNFDPQSARSYRFRALDKQVPHRAWRPVRNDTALWKAVRTTEVASFPVKIKIKTEIKAKIKIKVKVKIKGDGQECPSHTIQQQVKVPAQSLQRTER